MCEEYESLHDRSGQPDMVIGQSMVLSEMKEEVLLEDDDQQIRVFYCSDMKNELIKSFTDRQSEYILYEFKISKCC